MWPAPCSGTRAGARGHPGPSADTALPACTPSSQTHRHTHTLTQTQLYTPHEFTPRCTPGYQYTQPHLYPCSSIPIPVSTLCTHTDPKYTCSFQHTHMANACIHMYTQPHMVHIYTHARILSTQCSRSNTQAPTYTLSHMNTPERTFLHTCVCYSHIYSHDQMCTHVHIETHVHTICSFTLTHVNRRVHRYIVSLPHPRIHIYTRAHLDTECVH